MKRGTLIGLGLSFLTVVISVAEKRTVKELAALVRMWRRAHFSSHEGHINSSLNSLVHRRKERGNTGRCPAKSHMSE